MLSQSSITTSPLSSLLELLLSTLSSFSASFRVTDSNNDFAVNLILNPTAQRRGSILHGLFKLVHPPRVLLAEPESPLQGLSGLCGLSRYRAYIQRVLCPQCYFTLLVRNLPGSHTCRGVGGVVLWIPPRSRSWNSTLIHLVPIHYFNYTLPS